MRILAIRGENLASLEDAFELRLDADPLGRAGLFAIVGPTGAGKSTLLDAICLCLYDRTPRLADRGGAAVRLVGVEDETALPANDQRNILRRGAGKGWAEVDFTGRGGGTWTARWEVRRARERADGRVQSQDMVLTAPDGTVISGKKTEVLEAIVAQVGLDFDQFRRSVLLAQGDFAAFLRASEAERATLLEQMTGTGIYSALSKEAWRRSRDLHEERRRLETRLGEHGVLDEEARAEAEVALTQAIVAREEAAGAVKLWEAAATWHTKDQGLVGAIELATQRKEQARVRLEASQPRRVRFDALSAAWPLRQQAAEAERSAREAQRAGLLRDRAQTETARAAQAREAASTLLDQTRADLALELDALRDQLEARLQSARQGLSQARSWLAARPALVRLATSDRLQELLGDGDAIGQIGKRKELVDRLEGLRAKERPTLEARLEAARRGVAQATTTRDQAEATLGQATAEAEAAAKELEEHEARLSPARSEALNTQRSAHTTLVGLAEQAAQAEGRLDQAKAQQANLESRLQEAKARAIMVAQELTTLQATLPEAEASLRAARAAADATDLRAQLVDGEPCSVCGSEHHPWADGSPLAAVFNELEQRVATLREQHASLEKEQSVLGARSQANAEAREAATVAHAAATQALVDLGARWTAACEGLPEAAALIALAPGDAAPTAGPRRDAIIALGNRLGQAEKALRQDQSARDQATVRARSKAAAEKRAREALEQARAAQEAATRAVPELEGKVALLAKDEADLSTRIESLQAQLDKALDPVAAELPEAEGDSPLATWREHLGTPGPLLEALEAAARGVADHKRLEERGDTGLRELAEPTSAARVRAEAAAASAPDQVLTQRRADRSDLAGPAHLQPQQLSPWLSDRAQATELRLRAHAEAMTEAEATAQQAAQAAAAALATASTLAAEAARTAAQLEADRVEQGLDEAVLTELLGLRESWKEDEARALEALDRALEEATVRLDERTQARQEHQATRPELDATEASEALAAARTARATTDEAWSQAKAKVEQDDRTRKVVARLQAQVETHDRSAEPWHQLSRCIGSGDGKAFRKFAQSLTLELLLEQANHHLRSLHPRYRLARIDGTDLDVLVVDRDLGDEPRTVRSLSGGESFLVSLALALALSSLSSKDVRVESLFIDEGFGTLDARSLDIALSVLDSLQADGRQVGIISHVGGLAERIGVQVSVQPEGGGRSSVKIVEG